MYYRANSTTGNRLFYEFQSDFDRWTPEFWEIAHRFTTRNLRAQLIVQGVMVPAQKERIVYTKTLQLLLEREEPNND
jgi:hypothetical protein